MAKRSPGKSKPTVVVHSAASEHPLAARTGARRRSEIPAEVLAALNAGELATVNLVEALAVDIKKLAGNVFRRLGHDDLAKQLETAAASLADAGVLRQLVGMGSAIHDANRGRKRTAVFEQVASHPSDTIRSWACFAIQADRSLNLTARLAATRRFAADRHFGVRECAWMSARPYYAEQLDLAIELLTPWITDPDPNIRRFAIESTRPRGVWCAHLTALKSDPQRAAELLEPVRSDSSRYVQASVANWLNDASKNQPGWVQKVCRRWLMESPTKETAWIVKRAVRSIDSAK